MKAKGILWAALAVLLALLVLLAPGGCRAATTWLDGRLRILSNW